MAADWQVVVPFNIGIVYKFALKLAKYLAVVVPFTSGIIYKDIGFLMPHFVL